MKEIIFVLLAALITSTNVCAQDDGTKKLTKEERKALQAREDSLLNVRAMEALADTSFVLEADQVVFKRGHVAYVTPTTNFVAFCGGGAVVQVAFNVPWPGFNGLGGITVEGSVSKYEVSRDKRGNVYVEGSVSGRGISAQITLTLYAGGNKASATVMPNFHSGRITLEGSLVPVEDSQVFKGTTI